MKANFVCRAKTLRVEKIEERSEKLANQLESNDSLCLPNFVATAHPFLYFWCLCEMEDSLSVSAPDLLGVLELRRHLLMELFVVKIEMTTQWWGTNCDHLSFAVSFPLSLYCPLLALCGYKQMQERTSHFQEPGGLSTLPDRMPKVLGAWWKRISSCSPFHKVNGDFFILLVFWVFVRVLSSCLALLISTLWSGCIAKILHSLYPLQAETVQGLVTLWRLKWQLLHAKFAVPYQDRGGGTSSSEWSLALAIWISSSND